MRIFNYAALIAALSTGAFGSTVTCAPGSDNAVTAGAPSTYSLTCGGETFDNFQVVNPDGGAAGIVDVQGATYNTQTGQVTLIINPNLSGKDQDELFLYQVSGAEMTGFTVALGGTDASVSETACSGAIPLSGPLADLCPPQQYLSNTWNYNNDPNAPQWATFLQPSDSVYIVKDIETGNSAGAQLSNIDESFQTVPEPATLMLLGAGLCMLGIARRRNKYARQ